jgi:hypothetical protein
MAITSTGGRIYWNYFLALERDLELISRYVEFCEQNLSTYSIELTHLFLASASEVDVVAKLVCAHGAPRAPRENIDQYREVLRSTFPELPEVRIQIPRYGLSFSPWENWAGNRNPDWWRSYNNVKHERNTYFNEATLKNALNAVGGLLILVHRYYRAELSGTAGQLLDKKDTSYKLSPESSLIRLPDDFYHQPVYM